MPSASDTTQPDASWAEPPPIKPTLEQCQAYNQMLAHDTYVIDADIGAGKTLPAVKSGGDCFGRGLIDQAYIVVTPAGRKQWRAKLREYFSPANYARVRFKHDNGWLAPGHISVIAYSELVMIEHRIVKPRQWLSLIHI